MPLSWRSTCVLFVGVLAMCVGCVDDGAEAGASPTVIRVAVLPGQSEDRLLTKHGPLLDYLRSETGLEFDLSIPRDYADLLERFDAGEVDLAWFGGLTFTQAEHRSGAVPLASRDIDLQFTSCYLVGADDERMSIRDFQGERFSFGPMLSTSGYLMPRYYMNREGLDPDSFFGTVTHSSGHDQTAFAVRDGTIALGVANCAVVASLFDSGALDPDEVRILETTPPYSDYVWAVPPTMDRRTQVKLLDAFLGLDASKPRDSEILRLQGANIYMPAGISDFEIIRTAAIQAGVLSDGASNAR